MCGLGPFHVHFILRIAFRPSSAPSTTMTNANDRNDEIPRRYCSPNTHARQQLTTRSRFGIPRLHSLHYSLTIVPQERQRYFVVSLGAHAVPPARRTLINLSWPFGMSLGCVYPLRTLRCCTRNTASAFLVLYCIVIIKTPRARRRVP